MATGECGRARGSKSGPYVQAAALHLQEGNRRKTGEVSMDGARIRGDGGGTSCPTAPSIIRSWFTLLRSGSVHCQLYYPLGLVALYVRERYNHVWVHETAPSKLDARAVRGLSSTRAQSKPTPPTYVTHCWGSCFLLFIYFDKMDFSMLLLIYYAVW
jgi:hypothetical protein